MYSLIPTAERGGEHSTASPYSAGRGIQQYVASPLRPTAGARILASLVGEEAWHIGTNRMDACVGAGGGWPRLRAAEEPSHTKGAQAGRAHGARLRSPGRRSRASRCWRRRKVAWGGRKARVSGRAAARLRRETGQGGGSGAQDGRQHLDSRFGGVSPDRIKVRGERLHCSPKCEAAQWVTLAWPIPMQISARVKARCHTASNKPKVS